MTVNKRCYGIFHFLYVCARVAQLVQQAMMQPSAPRQEDADIYICEIHCTAASFTQSLVILSPSSTLPSSTASPTPSYLRSSELCVRIFLFTALSNNPHQ